MVRTHRSARRSFNTVLMFFGVAALLTVVLSRQVSAATIRVPEDRASISEALVGARAGDIILLAPGTYSSRQSIPVNVTIRGSTPLGSTRVSHGFGEFVSGSGDGFTIESVDFVSSAAHFENSTIAQVGGTVVFRGCRFQGFTENTNDSLFRVSSGCLRLIDCEFVNIGKVAYSSLSGACIRLSGGRLEAERCIFRNTQAAGSGVLNQTSGEAVFTSCVLDGNQGRSGGGVGSAYGGTCEFVNCTFLANQNSSTVPANIMLISGTAQLAVRNSVARNHPHSSLFRVASGSPTIEVANSNIQGGYPGVGNIDVDPLFVDAANGDFRLGAGSPCIDAGDNAAAQFIPGTDFNGRPRFVDIPGVADTGVGPTPVIDMGAFERQPEACTLDTNANGQVEVDDLFDYIDRWFGELGQPCR